MAIHLTINYGWSNIAVSTKDVDPNIESNGKILSLIYSLFTFQPLPQSSKVFIY